MLAQAQEQGDALEGTSLEDVEDCLREFEENQNQSGTYQKLLQVKSQILSLRQTMAARREEQERVSARFQCCKSGIRDDNSG